MLFIDNGPVNCTQNGLMTINLREFGGSRDSTKTLSQLDSYAFDIALRRCLIQCSFQN